MRHPLRLVSITLLLLSCLLLAPPAVAHGTSIIERPHRGARPLQLDLHAGFAYVGKGLAAGARIGFPIVNNGFVPRINNAVYINVGADLYFIDGGKKHAHSAGIGIPLTLHWEFYFTREWSAFAELGPNLFIHPSVFKGDGWTFSGPHWLHGAIGGRYFFDRTIALTLRLGSPYSSLGVSFFF